MRGSGLAGIGLGIGANLIWGLTFLVPVLLGVLIGIRQARTA